MGRRGGHRLAPRRLSCTRREVRPHASISLLEADIEDYRPRAAGTLVVEGLDGLSIACPAHMFVLDVGSGAPTNERAPAREFTRSPRAARQRAAPTFVVPTPKPPIAASRPSRARTPTRFNWRWWTRACGGALATAATPSATTRDVDSRVERDVQPATRIRLSLIPAAHPFPTAASNMAAPNPR